LTISRGREKGWEGETREVMLSSEREEEVVVLPFLFFAESFTVRRNLLLGQRGHDARLFPMTMVKCEKKRRRRTRQVVCVSGTIKCTGEISLTHNLKLYPP
jgi:hypothetical protein